MFCVCFYVCEGVTVVLVLCNISVLSAVTLFYTHQDAYHKDGPVILYPLRVHRGSIETEGV